MTLNNKDLINSLLEIIEQKLNWGKSCDWSQRDFEMLTDAIYEQTKVAISLSTLKRIWKGDYKQLPNVSTLNALAQFSDYKSWQDFKASCCQNSLKETPVKRTKRESGIKEN